MRITGGHYKNRKLYVPDGTDVRPTSDRMRQSLFNMLHHASWAKDFDFAQAHVLDLFCGSGALGLESVSHGALHCTFIDRDITAIEKNAAFLPQQQKTILRGNLPDMIDRLKGKAPFSLVFLDPPYRQNLVNPVLDALIKNNFLHDNAIIIAETEKEFTPDTTLIPLDTRIQSQSALHIYRFDLSENQ